MDLTLQDSKKIHSISAQKNKNYIKVNDQGPIYLRDLLQIVPKRNGIEINLVEDSSSILKRFGSGGYIFRSHI